MVDFQLNATQLHLIRERSMPHMCTDEKDLTSEDKVRCLNNLCKQKGLQAMALRDIKLTSLEAVIHRYRNRIKVSILNKRTLCFLLFEDRHLLQNLFHRGSNYDLKVLGTKFCCVLNFQMYLSTSKKSVCTLQSRKVLICTLLY